MTTDIDVLQRMQELEMLLFGAFEAVKRPNVTSSVEEKRVFLQVSWVHASNADSSLDSRCALTVVLTRQQLERYAHMNANARDVFRQQLQTEAIGYFDRQHAKQSSNNCSVEYEVPDTLLEQ